MAVVLFIESVVLNVVTASQHYHGIDTFFGAFMVFFAIVRIVFDLPSFIIGWMLIREINRQRDAALFRATADKYSISTISQTKVKIEQSICQDEDPTTTAAASAAGSERSMATAAQSAALFYEERSPSRGNAKVHRYDSRSIYSDSYVGQGYYQFPRTKKQSRQQNNNNKHYSSKPSRDTVTSLPVYPYPPFMMPPPPKRKASGEKHYYFNSNELTRMYETLGFDEPNFLNKIEEKDGKKVDSHDKEALNALHLAVAGDAVMVLEGNDSELVLPDHPNQLFLEEANMYLPPASQSHLSGGEPEDLLHNVPLSTFDRTARSLKKEVFMYDPKKGNDSLDSTSGSEETVVVVIQATTSDNAKDK